MGTDSLKMKAFLWKDIDRVSVNYHCDGSVLIVASSLERARELAKFETLEWRRKEGEDIFAKMDVEGEPTAIFSSDSDEEKVYVFPNAGCC